MPELPEVETVRSELLKNLRGKKLSSISIVNKGESALFPNTAEEVASILNGCILRNIDRVGKYMFWSFDNRIVVVHLRMTGNFFLLSKYININTPILDLLHDRKSSSSSPDFLKYARLILDFGDLQAVFIDKRRFGTFKLYPEDTSLSDILVLHKIGPDIFSQQLTIDYLQSNFKSRTKNIYSALLDQSILAGVGNIYAAEALFDSRISPLRSVATLTYPEIKFLLMSLRKIMTKSIKLQGTSFSDFATTTGHQGKFQDCLQVYGQTETNYGTKLYPVSKLKVTGRTVYWVPLLQK